MACNERNDDRTNHTQERYELTASSTMARRDKKLIPLPTPPKTNPIVLLACDQMTARSFLDEVQGPGEQAVWGIEDG